MRRGYTPSKPYLSRETNRVSRDLRGPTILAMSPRTRTSFTIIRLVMDPWVIPRGTLASPRPTHLHHHYSSPRQQLPPVPHTTSRTRCFHLLSALTHSGTRPRSTESSSHRTWRRFALMYVLGLANQAIILQQQQSLQSQLAQLLAFHHPPPPPPPPQ